MESKFINLIKSIFGKSTKVKSDFVKETVETVETKVEEVVVEKNIDLPTEELIVEMKKAKKRNEKVVKEIVDKADKMNASIKKTKKSDKKI